MKNLNPLYTELGNLIKQRRLEKGLSLEELAYRCGLHLNGIWKIEKAKSEIKLSTLLKIFKELDIKLSALEAIIK